jgi:hypothetical protein
MLGRQGLQAFWNNVFTFAVIADVAVEAAIQGIKAGFPGLDGRTDNLSLIGAGRGLVWGETESSEHFAARLRNWLETAADMGGDIGLALQLWNYIAGNPQVRVISRNGLFTTVSASGVVAQTQGTWNWDSISNPERAGFWWDYWIVVYPATGDASGFYVDDVGVWGDFGNGLIPSDDLGWGHNCTRKEVGTIQSIVATWKGAHVNLKNIIWCNGTDVYGPTPVSGSPDGTWGIAYVVSSDVPSRNTTDDFWFLGLDTNTW